MRSSIRVVVAGALSLHGAAAHAQGGAQGGTAPRPPSDQAIGQRFEVRADALPKPYEDKAVRNTPLIVPREGRVPVVPEGFEVALVAENLQGPRQLLVLPDGDLLVAMQAGGLPHAAARCGRRRAGGVD